MNVNGDIYPDPNDQGQSASEAGLPQRGVICAALSWLWIWIWHGGKVPPVTYCDVEAERQYRAAWNYPWNRNQRRMAARKTPLPASRRPSVFDRVISRGLTPTQRLERYANLSIRGRLRTYGMRSGAKRAVRLGAHKHKIKIWLTPPDGLSGLYRHCHPGFARGP